mmetsp:Transcript_6047/g.21353  ORF Transcript_6047/g.21353 Transcript_6047/m.21353 type:complete len:201 (+) Transcript_6047:1631-2233(+)
MLFSFHVLPRVSVLIQTRPLQSFQHDVSETRLPLGPSHSSFSQRLLQFLLQLVDENLQLQSRFDLSLFVLICFSSMFCLFDHPIDDILPRSSSITASPKVASIPRDQIRYDRLQVSALLHMQRNPQVLDCWVTWCDSTQQQLTEKLIVTAERSLALKHFDENVWSSQRPRAEVLRAMAGERGSSLDQLVHDPSLHFNANG